jgi:hypothetical protein
MKARHWALVPPFDGRRCAAVTKPGPGRSYSHVITGGPHSDDQRAISTLGIGASGPTAYRCAAWREDRLVKSRVGGGKKG